MKLSIIVPVYNEAQTIATVIERIRSRPYYTPPVEWTLPGDPPSVAAGSPIVPPSNGPLRDATGELVDE